MPKPTRTIIRTIEAKTTHHAIQIAEKKYPNYRVGRVYAYKKFKVELFRKPRKK